VYLAIYTQVTSTRPFLRQITLKGNAILSVIFLELNSLMKLWIRHLEVTWV